MNFLFFIVACSLFGIGIFLVAMFNPLKLEHWTEETRYSISIIVTFGLGTICILRAMME